MSSVDPAAESTEPVPANERAPNEPAAVNPSASVTSSGSEAEGGAAEPVRKPGAKAGGKPKMGGKPGHKRPGQGGVPGPAAAADAPPALPALPSGPSAAEVAQRARRERARRLMLALALWVGLPTLLGVVYYGALAPDEFESAVTVIMSGAPDEAEMHAVMLREHVLSRDMMTRLEREAQLGAHYTSPKAGVTRLSSDAGSESRYAYYRRHVDARFDKESRVFTLRVRAYSGKDAQRFARAMLQAGAEFVQSVSGVRDASPFVVVAQPSAPNEATHPHRVYGVLTVFFASLSLFGIGALLIAAVREHAQF